MVAAGAVVVVAAGAVVVVAAGAVVVVAAGAVVVVAAGAVVVVGGAPWSPPWSWWSPAPSWWSAAVVVLVGAVVVVVVGAVAVVVGAAVVVVGPQCSPRPGRRCRRPTVFGTGDSGRGGAPRSCGERRGRGGERRGRGGERRGRGGGRRGRGGRGRDHRPARQVVLEVAVDRVGVDKAAHLAVVKRKTGLGGQMLTAGPAVDKDIEVAS